MTAGGITIEKERIPVSKWTIVDLLGVVFCSFGGAVVFYITLLELLGDNKTTFSLARYVGSLLTIFLPLFWIKKRYGLSKEILGLRKGHLRMLSLVLIGILPAIIYSFLLWMTPLWRSLPALTNMKASDYYIYLILAPISINGFATLVLTPISEEVLDRGFIYGYLRRKLGIVFGLILQALFFSLLHFDFMFNDAFFLISNKFFIGLILGILYETTGSIYPSIVCHSIINYLAIVFSMKWM